MEGYTGEGEPPCIVMTLKATNKNDANFTVTLDGIQPLITLTITRSPNATNFLLETSTDEIEDDSFSGSVNVIGKLYMVYENCETMHKLWFIQSGKL